MAKKSKRQRLPLVSSERLMAALIRLGFTADPKPSGGSHLSLYRERPDGTKDVTTVVLGKKELPRGTLRAILRLAKVSDDQFIAALQRKTR